MRGTRVQPLKRPGGASPGPIARTTTSESSQCEVYVLLSDDSTIKLTGSIWEPELLEAIRKLFDRRPR